MFNRQKFFEHFLNVYLKQDKCLTQGQVYAFLYHSHKHGFLYHLDDDPSEIYITEQGHRRGKLFSPREVEVLGYLVPAFCNLPDYENDPHRICCEVSNHSAENVRTLPRWRFNFDEDEQVDFIGFTEPRLWNGWGCPLLAFSDFNKILSDGRYQFTVSHEGNVSTFLITGTQDDNYDPSDYIVIQGEPVLSRLGDAFTVYDTAPLGLCFNVDDCYETNADDWQGYF